MTQFKELEKQEQTKPKIIRKKKITKLEQKKKEIQIFKKGNINK
jgi:hypothetical protein